VDGAYGFLAVVGFPYAEAEFFWGGGEQLFSVTVFMFGVTFFSRWMFFGARGCGCIGMLNQY
jgi:hypothetical protein